MEESIVVVLDARELMELERALMDREPEDALRFLREIRQKVERTRRARLKAPLG